MHTRKLCVSLMLLLGAGFSAFAQTATVNGVVTDSSRAIIAGASITITNLDTGLRRETRTNEAGNYTFTLLPVGRYKVDAGVSGFSTQSHPQLQLDVDQVLRLDFTLKPGALSESVDVSASAARNIQKILEREKNDEASH